MERQFFLFICVGLPLIGSFLLPLLGRISPRVRNISALIIVLVSFSSAAALLPYALDGEAVLWQVSLSMGFGFGLYADTLAVFMALASSFIAAIIVFFSFSYIECYENQNEYYSMVVLFIGSMMGLVFSTSLICLYLFWEISAICCWRLIGFFREREIIRRANKAFLMTAAGAMLMLFGFIIIYNQFGTFNLLELKGASLPDTAVLLIMCGILSKSATLPFHSWLPDAGVAPSPITSLLHAAVLVKIGVYVFARLFLINFEISAIWNTVIPIVAAISAIVSAGAAFVENDIKRIIAYSTISQLAFILLGLSCGSSLGIAGGLLYILMHGLAKGGLFLCAGIVEHHVFTKDIQKMGGLFSTMPITGIAFLLCAFSIMGFPPLGGFFAKYMVIGGAVDAGQPWWICAAFILGAIMTIMYLLRLFIKVFCGEPRGNQSKESGWEMIVSVSSLAVLSLLGGFFINVPSDIVTAIIETVGK